MNDPLKMINNLDQLMDRLTARVQAIRKECADIVSDWDGLGDGQRADHAAVILTRLRPHLDSLARFANDSIKQINEMVADPFCRLNPGE